MLGINNGASGAGAEAAIGCPDQKWHLKDKDAKSLYKVIIRNIATYTRVGHEKKVIKKVVCIGTEPCPQCSGKQILS